MKQLLHALIGIGLNEKEAKIYLTLLQLGTSNPYQIAKISGLKRPTAYVITQELVKKGFALQVPGKVHTYTARPIEIIFEEYENKLNESKKLLPEFQALHGNVADKPSVLYFEGIEGMKQALMYKIKEYHNTEIVGFYANPDFVTQASQDAALEFNEYRSRHNIKVKALLTETDNLKPFAKYLQDFSVTSKFIPKNLYNSNASFEFYPNLVKIIFYDTADSVIIESPTVAKAMKQIFELLWARLGSEFSKSKNISTFGH